MIELPIAADDAGQRVDRFLRKLLSKAPLALLQRWLRQGAVRVDGARVPGAHRLAAGAVVTLAVERARFDALCTAPRTAPRTPTRGGTAPLAVVHRDDDLLVVDKPGGLAVHGGTGTGPDHLVARLAGLLPQRTAHTFRPAPAHRIDRATSGLVVIGCSAVGLRGMTRALRERRVRKTYLAVVHGGLTPREGVLAVALDVRDRGARARKALAGSGRPARTRYRTIARIGALSVLELEIETGVTHQIRAHLGGQGAPIVGDRRYGAPASSLPRERIALHAWRLEFDHPVDGRPMVVVAPVPTDLSELGVDPSGVRARAPDRAR